MLKVIIADDVTAKRILTSLFNENTLLGPTAEDVLEEYGEAGYRVCARVLAVHLPANKVYAEMLFNDLANVSQAVMPPDADKLARKIAGGDVDSGALLQNDTLALMQFEAACERLQISLDLPDEDLGIPLDLLAFALK